MEEFPVTGLSPRFRWIPLVLGILLVAMVAGGCRAETGAAPEAVQNAAMNAGLEALYPRNDPAAAIIEFRKVLAVNPRHYGATYQLATALDRAGRADEARPYWEKMKTMAEEIHDEQTLRTVRARLGTRETNSEEAIQGALMNAGLEALDKNANPAAAAVEFRKLLERNPNHYGATFQLATALDRAGKPAEARPLWEKVLKMAEGYKDKPTADIARSRLARNP
jgi:Tfp pilus assembly protein PilF